MENEDRDRDFPSPQKKRKRRKIFFLCHAEKKSHFPFNEVLSGNRGIIGSTLPASIDQFFCNE